MALGATLRGHFRGRAWSIPAPSDNYFWPFRGCSLDRALAGAVSVEESYLVDSASSHMLVSKIKPCMSKYKQSIL
jgi:hypothetical protein